MSRTPKLKRLARTDQVVFRMFAGYDTLIGKDSHGKSEARSDVRRFAEKQKNCGRRGRLTLGIGPVCGMAAIVCKAVFFFQVLLLLQPFACVCLIVARRIYMDRNKSTFQPLTNSSPFRAQCGRIEFYHVQQSVNITLD